MACVDRTAEKCGCELNQSSQQALTVNNLPPAKKEPGPVRAGFITTEGVIGINYIAVLSVQETRLGGLVTITAFTTPFETIEVDGNHGGANPPCEKRRSK